MICMWPPRSLVDEGWYLLTAVLNFKFGVLNLKTNSNSTQFIELYFGVSEQLKPLQPIGQTAEFKFESKFEPLPTSAGHLAIIPEGYFRRQSKDLTAKSMAKLLGRRVGRASTNTGRFRVGGSRCGPRPARLRKTHYHSCDTDLVRELKRF